MRRPASRHAEPPSPPAPEHRAADPVPGAARAALLAGAGVFLALAVFLSLMAWPDPTFGDVPELTTVAYRLGIAHPTGYPLLTMLGKLATLLPLGSPAHCVNMLDALIGALAGGVMCLLVVEAFGNPWAGVVSGLAFGLSPVMWANSTSFEVYPLSALFMLSTIALANRAWAPDGAMEQSRRARYLKLAALVAGLSVSHHLTSVATLPAALWIAFHGRRTWLPARRDLLRAAGCFAIGLLPWLYLPIRGALSEWDPYSMWAPLDSLAGVIAHLTARQYGGLLFAYGPGGVPLLLERNAGAIWEQFGPLLVFALPGLWALRGRGAAVAQAAVVLLGINFALFFGYAVADYEVFFVPSYAGVCVLIGAGIAGLARLGRLPEGRWRLAPAALALALLAVELPGRYQELRPHPDAIPSQYVREFGQEIGGRGVVLFGGQWKNLAHTSFPLMHAKRVEEALGGMDFENVVSIEQDDVGPVWMAMTGASTAVVSGVQSAPPEDRLDTFVQVYDGPRPLYTESPVVFEGAGRGGALRGYVWRVLPKPGYRLECDPKALLGWVQEQARKPSAGEDAQANLATPVLNYASYLEAVGQIEKAMDVLRWGCKVLPLSRELAATAAMRASASGDTDLAWDGQKRLAQLARYSSRTYLIKGVLLLNENKHREALDALNLARAVDRVTDRDDLAYARAACYLALGDRAAAEEAAGERVWPLIEAKLRGAQ